MKRTANKTVIIHIIIRGIETDQYVKTSVRPILIPNKIIPSRKINFKEKFIPLVKISPILMKLPTTIPINIANNTVDIGLFS